MPPTYKEKIASIGPSTAGFTWAGSRAVVPYLVLYNELEDSLIDLLGDVVAGEDGRLNRTLPKAHPKFPWLFAEAINEIRGYGDPTYTSAESELEAAPIPAYADYDQYLLTVEFSTRPYAVLSDDLIEVTSSTYIPETGGAAVNYKYVNEWDRFLDWSYNPAPELLTAQHGQFKFRTSAGSPGGVAFQGRPTITVPAASVSYFWYQVPNSYLNSANSYLDKYIGYVNQVEWDGWPAGSLLYLGPKVIRRYPPIMPEMTLESGGSGFSLEKFIDVELSFSYTARTVTSAPTPSNGNWIAAGHNVQPWFGNRKFYYISADVASASDQYPIFLSIPFQLLFMNPDVT